jgi:DNA-binding CsgD family transcriptional regulator/sugar-specific transcriptional regulator TrmB
MARRRVPLLTAWGASPDADLVYRFLVERGPSDVEELHRELGVSRQRAAAALDELSDGDAVVATRRSGEGRTDCRLYRARPPDSVVVALRERRHRAVHQSLGARRRLATLSDLHLDMGPDFGGAARNRPLHGVAQVRARLTDLVAATSHEHLSMHPEPEFDQAAVRASAILDHDLLAGAVSVLTLGVPPSVADVTTAHTLELVRAGLHYRELPSLPTKMIIFDRQTAIVPLDPSDLGRGALEIQAPAMVERLAGWLLRHWAAARPPTSRTNAVAHLTARERRIVALLAAGHTDASTAAQLGLGERTVAQAVRGVMERLGVQNRFQLGLMLGAAPPAVPVTPALPAADPATIDDDEDEENR